MLKGNSIKITMGKMMLLLYTLVYMVISILPMFKYSVPYVISGSVCLSYALFVFIKYEKYRKSMVLLAFLGAIEGFVLFVNGQTVTTIANEPIRVVRCIIPCFILGDVIKLAKDLKLFLWFFISGLIIFVALKTLIELSNNEMIVRILASGETSEFNDEQRMQNIAGFEFSYAVGLTFPMWLILFTRAKNVLLRIAFILVAIFVAYYVVSAQYMILFLLCMLSLVIIIATGSKKFYVKLFSILFIIIMLLLSSIIFRWMASWNVGEMMNWRLNNLADFFEGKIAAEETSSRWALYRNAINAFFNSPIIGSQKSAVAAESHSWILSASVSAGIIGLACVITEIVVYAKLNKRAYVKNGLDLKLNAYIYTIFIILCVLNPIQYAYEIFILMFLYVPLTIDLFYKKRGEI